MHFGFTNSIPPSQLVCVKAIVNLSLIFDRYKMSALANCVTHAKLVNRKPTRIAFVIFMNGVWHSLKLNELNSSISDYLNFKINYKTGHTSPSPWMGALKGPRSRGRACMYK
jgi:hypothetical protein